MEVVAMIPARIDSSRFPAKMLAHETGKPLIQYAWEVAQAASLVTRVCIATDSTQIADAVRTFGGEVVMTGSHQNGTSRIAHAVREMKCDLVVNMQGDEPELDPAVIDATIQVIGNNSMATAACVLQADEIQNVHVVKVLMNAADIAIDFTRKTDCDSALRHIGLYVYKPDFLQTYITMDPTKNELERKLEQMRALDNGYNIAVARVTPQHGGIDTKEQYDAFIERNR